MLRHSSRQKLSLPSNPWTYFFIFLVANTLLSYSSIPLEGKLWIGLFGLVLPFFTALFLVPAGSGRAQPLDQGEFFPPLPLWGWGLLGLLAVAARFTRLTTLFVWPNFDESSYGFDAFHLAAGGSPRFFYGISQAPPFFVWGLALFFKAFGASLAALWFFPALISLSVVPLAYLAARSFFSKSFSFLCTWLAALSFWPVFVGRFALMTILILPAECLALWLVGRLLKAASPQARAKGVILLALVWGLGFYTHLHWPVVVVLTALPVLFWFLKNFQKNPVQMTLLAAGAGATGFLVVLPLLLSALREHYGGYLLHLWAFNGNFSILRQVSVWLSCLTSPFWGMDTSVHTYQPEWGGFLNPLFSSFFFLGIIEIVQKGNRPLYRWLLAGFILCLLPGLLTQDQETFRLFPIVPILTVGILLGFVRLLSPSAPRRNLVLAIALFAPAMTLDAVHLFAVYHRIWNDPASWGYYTKSVARYRAYGILRDQQRQEGPGLIFGDFVQGLPDQSLSVATYDFNAVLNPALDPSQAHWAAVLANVNYQPFLKKRFPDSRSYGLSKDFAEVDGGWMLFVFPVTPDRLETLGHWREAQQALEPFLDMDLCYVMGAPFENLLRELARIRPAYESDPFLRSCFFEKESDLELKQDLMWQAKGGMGIPEKDPALASLENAVHQGYPAAHLYEHMGILWLMHGDSLRARQAFGRALEAPLDLTDSRSYFSSLKSRGK